jgi:hypothetical protein
MVQPPSKTFLQNFPTLLEHDRDDTETDGTNMTRML